MKEQLVQALKSAVKEQFGVDVTPEFSRPEPQFGDYATNVAMQVAGRAGKNPREVAEALVKSLQAVDGVKEAAIAGPGFMNLRLNDEVLGSMWSLEVPQKFAGQTVVAEYSDPNPFKVLHAGHLYTSIMGDAIANLVEAAGGNVHRVNFGGDVGLHVGKTMWAIVQAFGGEFPEKLVDIDETERSNWMAARYVEGTNAYEDDEQAKASIVDYNKRVYALHAEGDQGSPFAQIYWTCRQWSYDYFDAFYARIGSHFEKYYPESSTAERGLLEVKNHVGSVFHESDGAVVFDGDAHGLHTRVFINREGLPTYEAKDVGLIFTKFDDYHFDRSIIITANEQEQYMQVVLKALEQFAPELALATRHLTHGMVKLAGGVKMSSRKGNFLRAVDVLDAAELANTKLNGQKNEVVSLGAVKYAFLKQRMGGDIVYDPEESVSLVGNSGPYLQYAHARACSILAKTGVEPAVGGALYDEHERALALKLSQYTETLEAALGEFMPHGICTYLYELAQVFNRFYEHSRVVGDEREALRVGLVLCYRDTLAHGLGLLGITAPDKL